jgi:Flp pilus assembly protein TadG
MPQRPLDRRHRSGQKGAAALFGLLILPAIFAAGGLAVDAGQLLVKLQIVRDACRASALAAFEHPKSQGHLAEAVGEASLRAGGIMTGSITVERTLSPSGKPVATATAGGIKVRTALASILSGNSWEWTIQGVRMSATRRPMAVSLVIDTSGSMCNSRPDLSRKLIDAGDGRLPADHFTGLKTSGGLNYLGPQGKMPKPYDVIKPSILVDYHEVPKYLLYDPAHAHACSASEEGTWFEDYVREAKRFAAEYLEEGYDLAGIVAFNWDAVPVLPLGPVNGQALAAALDSLRAEGPTNLAAGIRSATDQLAAADPAVYGRDMVLFTEGGANVMHARFTDVSSPARPDDPAFAYDPSDPSRPTQVPTVVPPGLGSIYPTEERPAPKEYVVLFNPNPFDRWVFEKRDPAGPVSWDNLRTADCSGPNYLHKFTPSEPPLVAQNRFLPTEPGAGQSVNAHHRTTIYGTYAVERCFDSYSYLDWEGEEHVGHADPSSVDVADDDQDSAHVLKFDLRIPAPTYTLTGDDIESMYPADPFVAAYLSRGAKLLRFDEAPARDLSLQPMMMALYEADRAKSADKGITIHTITYGFAVTGSWSTQVYVPNHALSGNDYLSAKRGWRTTNVYDDSYLGELSNYANSRTIPRPNRRDTHIIGEWQTQTRGHSVIHSPLSRSPYTGKISGPGSRLFYPTNTQENDRTFERYTSSLFAHLTRKNAFVTRGSPDP